MCYLPEEEASPVLPITIAEGLQPGLYVGLDEEVYINDPATSRTNIVDFRISPLQFWWRSRMNPAWKPKKVTPEMKKGKARHVYILEADEFVKRFAVLPRMEDYKDLLVKADDIKAFMDEHCISPKSGTKAQMIARINLAGYRVNDWDSIVEERIAENPGKIMLKPEEMDELEFARKMYYLHPEVRDVLQGGLAEVTLVWRDEKSGLMLKCRPDYMLPDVLVDFKTFNNSRGFEINKAACRAIMEFNLHLQARLYIAGWGGIQKLVKQSRKNIHGDVPGEWVDKFLAAEAPRFEFHFQQTEQPCEVVVKEFVERATKGATANAYWLTARDELRSAVMEMRRYHDQCGTAPWISTHGGRSQLDDIEVPWIIYG